MPVGIAVAEAIIEAILSQRPEMSSLRRAQEVISGLRPKNVCVGRSDSRVEIAESWDCVHSAQMVELNVGGEPASEGGWRLRRA